LNSLTINSPIDVSSGGGMTKGGAGNVIVGATALYTGSTIINQGTLTIGNGSVGNLNSASAVTITPQGTLGFNMAANDTLSNGIVDNGVITKSGANVNTLSGEISGSGGITINNTGGGALSLSTTVKSYTGATTINEGILRAVGDVLSPNSLLTIASSSTTTNPTLQLRTDSNTTFHTGGVQINGVASQVRQWTIDVGNVSTGANRTLTLAGTTFYSGYGTSPNNGTFNVTGTSGYTLAMDGIDLRPLTGGASGPDIKVASGVTLTIGTVTIGTSIGNSTGFTSTGAGDMVVTGDMVRATSSRTMNIAQNGPGSLTLAGSGATTSGSGGEAITLSQGTLNINSNNAIGAGTGMGVRTLAINGGTLDNTSGSAVTSASNSAVAINGSFTFGGTRALNLGTGAVTLGGGSEVSITAHGSSEALTLGGVITGGTATGLTKAGPGTLALTGASPSFSLPVTVTGGTLVVGVGGAGSVGSAITVNAGTLAGSGSTTGAVTIGDGLGTADAAISPGNSPGTFTTTAGLSFSADGVYAYELDTTSGSGDTIVANGVTINPVATFSFNASGSGAGLSDGQVLLLLENTSGSGIGGTFANLADGSTFTSGNFNFTANYSGGGGNDLTLTVSAAAVPEPASVALLGLGACGLLMRRRRLV
jgi:autotransporter-associated beta strand protein